MSDAERITRERVEELLVLRATEGLSDGQQSELDGLLSSIGDVDLHAFDRATADAARVLVGTHARIPAHVRTAVESAAAVFFGSEPADTRELASAAPLRTRWLAWSGWLAAAALLLLQLFVWRPAASPSLADQRTAIERAPDVLRLQWTATNDPLGRGATGQVLWSAERQSGFMTFRGLAPNDVKQLQYQLWIFDASRDDRYPVDGGVFDIPTGVTEVVVPIRAAVHVTKPTLFAITAEIPGGVVVSTRERICVTAKVG